MALIVFKTLVGAVASFLQTRFQCCVPAKPVSELLSLRYVARSNLIIVSSLLPVCGGKMEGSKSFLDVLPLAQFR